MKQQRELTILMAALALLAAPRPAEAYIDPGSGAMIWQLLAAAAIGSLFYVRRVARWVRSLFRRKPGTDGTFS